MKSLIIIIPFIILVSLSNINVLKNSKSILITPQSQLQIKGTSNVNDFKCGYNIKNLNDPILIEYESANNVIRFKNSTLILENDEFNCGGRGINKDFHSLLKSNEYPQIILKLKEVKLKPNKKNRANTLIEIDIAGSSNTYIMETEFYYDDNWMISGQLKLNIQDFELEAPKKMLGLIVVSENIEISFKLVVKECGL